MCAEVGRRIPYAGDISGKFLNFGVFLSFLVYFVYIIVIFLDFYCTIFMSQGSRMFSRDSLSPIPRGIGIDLAVILPARGMLARGPLRENPSYIKGPQGWSRFNCARNLA